MATLLDIINRNAAPAATPTPQLGQTQSAQNLLQAKTGKQVSGGSDTGISDIQEKAVADQTKLNLIPLQQQAAMQSLAGQQASAGIQQDADQTQASQAQARTGLSLQGQIQTNQLLQDMEQNKGQLDLAKDNAKLQQLAFGLRMQDQQYVDNLQMAGAKNRLDDQAQFDIALQKSIFGENTDLLQQQLGGKSLMDANDREFKQFLNGLTIEQATALAKTDLDHAAVMSKMQTEAEGRKQEKAAETARQSSMWNSLGQLPSGLSTLAGKLGSKDGTVIKSKSNGVDDSPELAYG